MRVATWISLVLSLGGALVPIVYLSPVLVKEVEVLIPAGIAALPFLVVAHAAWTHRAEPAAAAVAVISVVNVLIAAAGWMAAAGDGISLGITGLCCVPYLQLLVWSLGLTLFLWLGPVRTEKPVSSEPKPETAFAPRQYSLGKPSE